MMRSTEPSAIRDHKKVCAANGIHKNQRYFAYPSDVITQEPKSAVCLRRNVFSNIFPLLETYIQSLGGVMYYAHQDAIIYDEFGDPELLKTFKNANLTIGSSIQDQYIGTTAASFVTPGTDAYLSKSDHYVDLFHKYASYCLQHTGYVRNMFIFIIIPAEKLDDNFLAYMRMSRAAMKSAITTYLHGLDSKLKQNAYSTEYDSSACLTIDLFGTIINANMQFFNWFDLEHSKVKGLCCFNVLPELRCIYDDLSTGKRITCDNVTFHNALHNMHHLHIETKPIFRGIKWLGTLIIISNKSQVKKLPPLKQHYSFNQIVGNSQLMRQLKQNAINAAQTNSYIVLTGESGTGKEYFAQAIHKESLRKNHPFVSINCSAMSAELISSELFGYVEGAFTGGRKGGAIGKFEYAHNGTIFLDEIGDMPISVQAVLLRVLEEKVIYKLGSNTPIPVDVRIICATNRDLKQMLKEGSFRLDLYYRINVIGIHLPPLRDRKEDLPLLLDCHLNEYNTQTQKIIKGFTTTAMERLLCYDWPGNIRELRNMIEYAAANSEGYIDVQNLPNDILQGSQQVNLNENSSFIQSERDQLITTMLKYNGNKSKAAKELGMSRGTLYKKLEEYHIMMHESTPQLDS